MVESYRNKIYARYHESQAVFDQEGDVQDELSRRIGIYGLNYRRLLPEDRGSRILELGCGPGYFLKYLESLGYGNAVGVEWSAQQVEKAAQLGVPNIVKSDIFEYMRGAQERSDLICSFHVLEHLFKEEVLELLELIYNGLTPEGRAIIEVPNAGSPLLGAHNRYIDFTHEVGFTPSSLMEVLLVSGFKRVEVCPVRDRSPYARLFFRVMNYLLHSRFTEYEYFEGGLIGIGKRKD